MEWIKCLKCGHDEFKISTSGPVHCAKCQTRLWLKMERIEVKEPYRPKPPQPSPEFPSHPDVPGPHMF